MSAASIAPIHRVRPSPPAGGRRRIFLLAMFLGCSSIAATAQAAGPSMDVQVSLTSYADNDGSGTITRHDVLTYTATATNTGDVPLTNVQFLGLGIPACASVAVGSSCTGNFNYTVTATDVSAGQAFETVSANANELPAGVDSPQTITPVFGGPDLTIAEVLTANADGDHTSSVTPGDVLTYTITATNSGGVALATVNISDSLLAPSLVACTHVAVGSSCVLTGNHTVSATDAANGQIVDRPSVTSNPTITSGFQYGNQFITPVATPSGAAMSVSIALDRYLDDSQPVAGSQAQFTVTATNAGSVALTNVTVSNPATSPGSIVCASVAVGATCSLTSIYTVTAADVANGKFGPLVGSATSTEVAGPVMSASYSVPLTPNQISSLAAIAGNAQSGSPGTPLPVLLTVQLQGTGVSGQVIVFTVVSGSAHVSSSEVITGPSGQASTQLVLGANPGPVNVLAQLKFHSQETMFTENNGTLLPAVLTIVSGNGQALSLGSQSAPLVVHLTLNGVPIANATIDWSGTNATLASATSVTDAGGNASNTATVQQAGPASVVASSTTPPGGMATFGLNGGLTIIPGLTSSEIAVANSLDHACEALAAFDARTAPEQDLLDQCNAIASAGALHPDQAANALDQLLPHVALLQTNASVLVTTAQFDNIKARLAALRSSSGGGNHFGGLAFNTPSGSLPIGSLGGALLGFDDKPVDKKPEVGAGFDRWGFFATGTFGNGSSDPGQNTPGYGFHTGGFTAGVDYRLNDHAIFGASAGYTNFSSDVDNVGGGLDTHGWSLSAYATFFRQDSWYADGVLTYGSNNYDITRRIIYALTTSTGTVSVNQTATSSASGNTFAGALTLGRDFSKGPWSFGPYLRGTWSRTDFGDYQEVMHSGQPGNGLGLFVASRSVTNVSSILGAKINYASSQSWGVLMPHAEVEWEHGYEDSPDSITAHFLQDPTATPFSLGGDAIDTDFFRLGLGVSFQFTHGRSGFIYYEKTLGLSGVTQDNIALGFRMEF